MTGPVDEVYRDFMPVAKADIRADEKSGHRRNIDDVSTVRSSDLSGQTGGIYVRSLQIAFDLDTSDTTSPDDGTTVLVDAAGNRFKALPDPIPKFVQAGSGAVQRTMQDKVREIVSITDFGCVGDGITDNSVSLQRAINAAAIYRFALLVPVGYFFVGSTINMPTGVRISILGHGRQASVFLTDLNAPLFLWNVLSTIEGRLFQNLGFQNTIATGVTFSASCVFRISGNGTSFFQHNEFDNLEIISFASFFQVDKATQTTVFGQESTVAWNSFDRIRIHGGNNDPLIGWQYTKGSGTGNSYLHCKVAVTIAMVQVSGVGCICGDIRIVASDVAGLGSFHSSVIQIGIGTTYNQRSLFVGGQIDAGGQYLAALDASGNHDYNNLVYTANNNGGAVDLYSTMPPIRNSVIDGMDIGRWRIGNYKIVNTTGAQTVDLFNIDMGNANSPGYNGSYIEMVVAGIVAGLAGGAILKRFMLRLSGGAATIATIESTGSPAPGSGFFDVVAAVAGSAVKLSVTFNSAGPNTNIDAQIEVVAGSVRVQRL